MCIAYALMRRKIMRVMITVSYDGTNYAGSQVQENGITIEEVLNRELSRFFNHDIKVIGASRTDSGVHALGAVFVFDVDTKMPAEKISYAINISLPNDIVVIDSKEVPSDFHPRFRKTNKTYEYLILNSDFSNPILRNFTYHYRKNLDERKMNEGIKYLIGEHDFTSFASIGSQTKTFVRTIFDADVKRDRNIIIISITGNGFLYNMVRIIVGTLVEVGNGKRGPVDIKKILEGKDRNLAGPTAPANGLILKEIKY